MRGWAFKNWVWQIQIWFRKHGIPLGQLLLFHIARQPYSETKQYKMFSRISRKMFAETVV